MTSLDCNRVTLAALHITLKVTPCEALNSTVGVGYYAGRSLPIKAPMTTSLAGVHELNALTLVLEAESLPAVVLALILSGEWRQ